MATEREENQPSALAELRALHEATLARLQRGDLFTDADLRALLRRLAAGAVDIDDPAERSAVAGWVAHWRQVEAVRALGNKPIQVDESGDLSTQRDSGGLEDGCPFPGVRPYGRADADRFAGRERWVDILSAQLDTADEGVVTLLGARGAGKTSLIEAGLLPALRPLGQEGGKRVISLAPGHRPLLTLAAALNSRQPDTDADNFQKGTDQALHLARALEGPKLMVVDRVEELVTLCQSEHQRRAFCQALADIASDAQADTRVLLSVDDTWEGALGEIGVMQRVMSSRPLRLTALTDEELTRVVTEAAGDVRWPMESLAAWTVEIAAHNEPLPLLQCLLVALWEAKSGDEIPQRIFDSMGGAESGLVYIAEQTYRGLTAAEQLCMAKIIERLVTRGPSGELTRRTLMRSALRGADDPSRVDRVLDRMERHCLVSVAPIGRDAEVELSVAALLDTWPRLVSWRKEWEAHMSLRDELKEAIDRWTAQGERERDLLSAKAVEEFSRLEGLTPRERQFLRRSQQRRRDSLTTRAPWAMGLALVGAITLALMGWHQVRQLKTAVRDARRAQESVKAALQSAEGRVTRAEADLEHARNIASQKSRAADDVRRELDQKVLRATQLADELEITRQRLRNKLATPENPQLKTLTAWVDLLELAAAWPSAPEPNGALNSESLRERRRKLVEALHETVAKQVAWYERAIHGGHGRRDKESRLRLLRLRRNLKLLKRRVAWARAETGRSRRVQWPVVSDPTPEAALQDATEKDKREILKLMKEGDGVELKGIRSAIKDRLKNPRVRSRALNRLGQLAYEAERFELAEELFKEAARFAIDPAERGLIACNRVHALYAQADTVTGDARVEMLTTAHKMMQRISVVPPHAGELRLQVRRAWAEAQRQAWREDKQNDAP